MTLTFFICESLLLAKLTGSSFPGAVSRPFAERKTGVKRVRLRIGRRQDVPATRLRQPHRENRLPAGRALDRDGAAHPLRRAPSRSRARAPSRPGARARSANRGRSARTPARAPRPRGPGPCPRRELDPGAVTIRTEPPAGVSRSAFSTRFETICSVRSASPIAGAAPAASASSVTPNSRAWPRTGATPPARSRQVDRLAADAELHLVHPRQVEQVADEALQSLRLADDRRRGLLGGQHSFGEALGIAADRSQRRLQLVADREQERPFRLARLRQRDRDLVEALREQRELARPSTGTSGGRSSRSRGRASPRRRAAPAGRSRVRAGTRSARRAPQSRGRPR